MIRMDETNSSTEASQALSIGPSEMHNSVLSREHIWWGFPFGIVAILFGAFFASLSRPNPTAVAGNALNKKVFPS